MKPGPKGSKLRLGWSGARNCSGKQELDVARGCSKTGVLQQDGTS